MEELRQGDTAGAPHSILDPRDLKYCRNQCTCFWNPSDDPFLWRQQLPLARWGLCEVQMLGYPLAALILWALWSAWYLAPIPAILLALVIYFFRDPRREVPSQYGAFVSPADGVVSEVTSLAHDEFIGGPAIRIGIFLSIFNVHINRAPEAGRVIKLRYDPGEFLNALLPESVARNESFWIGFEDDDWPHRRFSVRQIAGQWARRIVCDLRPGEVVPRGHKFGMIKLGSRTELTIPAEPQLRIEVQPGEKVCGGLTIMARYVG